MASSKKKAGGAGERFPLAWVTRKQFAEALNERVADMKAGEDFGEGEGVRLAIAGLKKFAPGDARLTAAACRKWASACMGDVEDGTEYEQQGQVEHDFLARLARSTGKVKRR